MDGLVAGVPVPPSALIGRAGELAAARSLLTATRVVTLVGPGGAGKTRLAIDVAAGHDGDVAFVDLTPLTDAQQVLPAIALALGLRDGGSRPLLETLRAHLRHRELLLVLDNAEHVLAAGPDLTGLLAWCAGVRILATSRASLQVPGEHLLAVDPLPVPDPRDLPGPDELAVVPSVALFVDRVRATCPGFTLTASTARTVAEICVALDGLPLALELAAAQVRAFGVDEVLTRTRSRFALLRRPGWAVPERHRSLEGAVRGSVDRLDPAVRALFAQLSVFTGGWTADAAAAVCRPNATGLDQLVDQSLVVVSEAGGQVRYRMLETLREWAAGLLDDGDDGPAVRDRHLAWAAALAASTGEPFTGVEGVDWLDRAAAEHANLRAALDRCAPGDPTGLRVAADLSGFWDVRGHLVEGYAHLRRLLDGPPGDPLLRSAALDALGRLAMYRSEHAEAEAALGESVTLSRAAGDAPAVAWSTATLALSAFFTDRLDEADTLAVDAVATARAGGGGPPLGRALVALFVVRTAQDRVADATGAYAEAVSTLLDPAAVSWARARTLYFAGWAARRGGDVAGADRTIREAARQFLAIDDRRSMADCLDLLGCVAAATGDPESALRRIAAAEGMRARSGVARHGYLAREVEPVREACVATLGRRTAAVVAGAVRVPVATLLADAPAIRGGLTVREAEVAALVATGVTNRRIAHALGISERTVERHLDHIRAKTGTGSRTEVAVWAVSVGLAGSTDTAPP